jgi:PAS domain S-box-containing protein
MHDELKLVRDTDGNPLEIVGYWLDITERKRAEEALEKANAELELRVEERTIELAAANERLRRDIAERKRVEESLRESEEKYRRLVEDSVDGIAIVEGLEIRFVNPAMLKMFGCQTEEEMLGHTFTDFVALQHRELMAERGRAREKRQHVVERYEFKALRKDDSEFDAELSVSAITYQGRVARQGIIGDITERKQMEEALEKARDELDYKADRQMRRRNPYGLTFREFTVLNLVATGRSDREIAVVLGISPLTVHKHVANVLGKTGAASRTEAGVRALREGLLD